MPLPCPRCARPTDPGLLDQAHDWAFWRHPDGACPACVQQELLETLRIQGDEALHQSVQAHWPLDAEAAFGALPTPLRLHADPRYTGRGVRLALVDSGFSPHPDLVSPVNRIRAWVDCGQETPLVREFGATEQPTWPEADAGLDHQWHGTMTSVVAAGNGFLGHGLYRGLASEAELVLVTARTPDGRIFNGSIARALRWLVANAPRLGIQVVSLSVAGEAVRWGEQDEVVELVEALVAMGIVVVAAAGNAGRRELVPPATAPHALTIGGIDDQNTLDHETVRLWQGNFGTAADGREKPELVAPSIWVAAPVLRGTRAADEATRLFAARRAGVAGADAALVVRKLITPHYQHADGTSFAAPIVASAVACLLEAAPGLSPEEVHRVLTGTARVVPGADRERQGAGALDAGHAIRAVLGESAGLLALQS